MEVSMEKNLYAFYHALRSIKPILSDIIVLQKFYNWVEKDLQSLWWQIEAITLFDKTTLLDNRKYINIIFFVFCILCVRENHEEFQICQLNWKYCDFSVNTAGNLARLRKVSESMMRQTSTIKWCWIEKLITEASLPCDF